MPNYYDSIYKENTNFCNQKPNELLAKFLKKLPKGKKVLDLGCGQGRDSFYLAQKNLHVTAVDNSKVAIVQIKEAIKEKNAKNIWPVCKDIAKFKIKPGIFGLINCQNALQFLPKKSALKTIENIKKNISPGGIIILTSFIAHTQPLDKNKSRFKPGEMKKLFSDSDFKIYYYFEGILNDKGHLGNPKPHKHGIVNIVAKKVF
ncbi:MAG TPA: class I SAM-dependent methyltransferase [Candidatus Moranbacteria bacterium]|nr:class I SAM-dependent methyltransferase [Candidatus Moranbacteria bacterium]